VIDVFDAIDAITSDFVNMLVSSVPTILELVALDYGWLKVEFCHYLTKSVANISLHYTAIRYSTQVIRNIPPNTNVERIYIIATNQVGLSSPKCPLRTKPGSGLGSGLGLVCRTTDTSRHGQLVRELNAAAAAITGPYFDSDFYTVSVLCVFCCVIVCVCVLR